MTNQNDTQDEAERLAKIWADEHYPHSRTYQTEGTNGWHGFIAGYRAGVASKEAEIKRCEDHGTAHALKLQEVVKEREALREENIIIKRYYEKAAKKWQEFEALYDDAMKENERLKSFGWRVDLANLKSQLAERDAELYNERQLIASLRAEVSQLRHAINHDVDKIEAHYRQELADSRAEVERLKILLNEQSHENAPEDYLTPYENELLTNLKKANKQLAAEKARAQKLVEAAKTLHDEVILILNKGPRGWDAHLETAISDICKALANYSTDSGDGEK